ncbi:MAG: tRNA glutamyl-Q(34) synthetase GluQRS [Burkholderiales bacterium]|nr:tRNA glutamyl-Q(34) synthetase GluQRS [Burkholderiales bacterium]
MASPDASGTPARSGRAQSHGPHYVGRFAPSPTGPLHFGSLVTALASYVDARAAGGRWLLRIEDVDRTRCSLAAEREIIAQLAGYGFEHDGEVVRQSERDALYLDALSRLQHAALIYACQCTRKQLADQPRNADGETIYPGTCRDAQLPIAPLAEAAPRATRAASPLALRLHVNDAGSPAAHIRWSDRCFGEQQQDVATEVGDFVLRRADSLFAYQLAVVVDDAAQGITDVVRGADLLGNTARQIVLQQRLGLPRPHYLHVPLVRNEDGQKMSKQTRAAPIHIDSALATLHAAWQFLGQAPVLGVARISDFWRAAIASWSANAVLPRMGDARRHAVAFG